MRPSRQSSAATNDADVAAARLCSAFEAGGDIDAITKDIVAFDQHVAKVDMTPIRNCIRRSSGTSTFRFAMSSWTAMAHSTAATTEGNSTRRR